MRKLRFMLAILIAVAMVLAGCGNRAQLSEDKINVVTSFYPLYDFAMQIGGEHVQVTNMVPAGTDPHDWSPKSQDIVNMSKGQLFVYNGAGFDDWWVDVFLGSLSDADRPHVVVASDGIDLIPAGVKHEAEHSDSDAHEHEADEHSDSEAHSHEAEAHDHEHDEEHSDSDAHEHEAEHSDSDTHEHEADEHGHDHGHDHGDYDPHVWLSPLNAIRMAENIKDGLIAVDPEHQADYEANYDILKNELQQLHEDYAAMTTEAPRKQFISSHEAFAYLARDYNLQQISIMGLSADAEPTSQDMKAISNFIEQYQVKYIMMEELASPKLAETMAKDLGIEILTLNPVEGLTKQQESEGENYISIMRHNLQSLKLALQE